MLSGYGLVFLVGILVGAIAGVFAMAMVQVARRADERAEAARVDARLPKTLTELQRMRRRDSVPARREG